MSDRRHRESPYSNTSDLKGRRGFSAPESDHIKVRPSNGSSSGNRFTPYGRPCNKSNNRSLSPDANKQENIDSKSASSNRHGSRTDDVNKAENVYHIPTQKYTEFEAKSTPPKVAEDNAPKKKLTVASVFNCDSSEEEEEIPMQARMRMRNVGKNTPTSSGPNSFGKTKRGFTDTVKMWEKDPVKVAQFIVEKRKEGDPKEDDSKKN